MPDHPLWPAFWKWAEENGCDSPYSDDWGPWWECFIAGAAAAQAAETKRERQPGHRIVPVEQLELLDRIAELEAVSDCVNRRCGVGPNELPLVSLDRILAERDKRIAELEAFIAELEAAAETTGREMGTERTILHGKIAELQANLRGAARLLGEQRERANQAEKRIADLEAALQSIISRCDDGDKRVDWLPTIRSIAAEAAGGKEQ